MTEDYHLSKKDKVISKGHLESLSNEVRMLREQVAEEEQLAKNDYRVADHKGRPV